MEEKNKNCNKEKTNNLKNSTISESIHQKSETKKINNINLDNNIIL